MKRHKNFNLLLMLVLLVAVGQMAQTIYIPAIADMAVALNVREGAVQSVMAAYLLTYGISQLFYGPLSDRVGRRPVILVGMSIFMLATLVAITTHSLPVLIAASAMQGMGTGVGGVMARTLPRDLYEGAQLRHANSLLNMGILVSPLIAPLLGGILDTLWSWRACYAFLLVLCAGVSHTGLFCDMTDEQWRTVMDVNVSGMFYLIRALAPGMIARNEGAIVTVSSMWGRVGASCEVAYSASKAAVIGLTRALAKELGPSGVRVNCIAPGVIDTRMMDEHSDETKAALAEETPLCRLGTPQDVAGACAFLLSDAAAFITGQVLGVDGGYI